MGDEERWVGDRLHDLVGFSDPALAAYVVAIGRGSRHADQVLAKLEKHEMTFASRDAARRFAKELVEKVGRVRKERDTLPVPSTVATASGKPAVKTNADLMREAQSYSMVLDEEEYDISRKRARNEHKKEKKTKRERRAKEEEAEGRTDETEYEKQLREYKEFIGTGEDGVAEGERIKARNEAREQRKRDEKEKELLEEGDQLRKQFTLEELREQSRYAYLKKREERELKLLEASIQDEEELFEGVKLTKREQRDLVARKELKRLVENRRQVETRAKGDLYSLPSSYVTDDGKIDSARRDELLLNTRYQEETREKTEQEVWEEQQRKIAKMSGKAERDATGAEYDLVLGDEVEFIAHELMSGTKETKDGGSDAVEAELSVEELKELSIAEGRKTLPMYAYRTELLSAVREHQVVVVVAETGSGKTTQIPQYLHEEGWTELGKIGCTQPRRVAAMSVAARVAQEMNVKLGHEVGYSIRFEDCTSPRTKIKYMTDGMLMREFLTSPDLAAYSCMMIDEAHERSLATDVLFGLLKDVAKFRKDLRLIVSSATLDAQKFSDYFNGAPIFNVPGRIHPVEIFYTKAPEADYLEASVMSVLQIHVREAVPGDILVFLTGQEEIEKVCESLLQRTRGLGSKIKELVICPIYASLPSEEQAKVFVPTPPGARKVVVATNIAETSLTINGIKHVIDVGFCKQTSYNPRTGMDSLVVAPVSQAGANQRAGRAGRTSAGKCYRLYTAWSYKFELEENAIPEIQRTNLSSTVLHLYSLGINDLVHFDFMDPPPAESLIRSLEQLYALGALNDKGELTKLGRRMAEFPTDPMLAKTLLAAERYGCVEEILTICAMLDIGAAVFYRPPEKAIHADTSRINFGKGHGALGDHMALRNVYEQWRDANYSANWCYENYVQIKSMRKARDVRDQLAQLCDRVEVAKNSTTDSESIRKAIAAGHFYHTAKLQKDGNYKTVKNQFLVHMHPSSSLYKEDPRPKWVLYHQLQFTKQEYMRQCIVIKPGWLVEIAPHYYKPGDVEEAFKKPKGPRSRNNIPVSHSDTFTHSMA